VRAGITPQTPRHAHSGTTAESVYARPMAEFTRKKILQMIATMPEVAVCVKRPMQQRPAASLAAHPAEPLHENPNLVREGPL